MRHRLFSIAMVVPFAVVIACGSTDSRSGFDEKKAEGDNPAPGQPTFTPDTPPCVGLDCKRVACGDGKTTTLKGKVYDPAGANPLYNVMVYIPGGTDPYAPPKPFKDSTVEGIACETCASVVVNPLVSALTNGEGEFVLENVPVDKDVPIVIQIGKWRRQLTIDIDKKCEANVVKDKTFRLPKNSNEGDMPQIAVTSGAFDALECLLRGIGIDEAEFVKGHDASGHVHLFQGYGGGMGDSADTFWNDDKQLEKYDIVLLSCEGDEHKENKGGNQPGARGSMYEYLNAGGRVFATHYHYIWFKESPQDELRQIADFSGGSSTDGEFDVNMSFPKGQMLATWLKATGASSSVGKITLQDVTGSMKKVNPPATTWIESVKPNSEPKFVSFNTPISAAPEDQCGRAVFSDLHITDKAGPKTIGECGISSGGLNGQQKALEFLFFDLSACVTDDSVAPVPPK